MVSDFVSQSSSEECPGHVGECEQQESAAAEGVDGEESWDGEQKVDQAESP